MRVEPVQAISRRTVKQTVIRYRTPHTEQTMVLPYLATVQTAELQARRRFGGRVEVLKVVHRVNGEMVWQSGEEDK